MSEQPQRNPALAYIHPGEVLREDYLEPLGEGPAWLAHGLGVPLPEVVELLAGLRPINAATALRLGRFLNTSPEFWLGLQSAFDLEVAGDSLETDLAAIQPARLPHLAAQPDAQPLPALPLAAAEAPGR